MQDEAQIMGDVDAAFLVHRLDQLQQLVEEAIDRGAGQRVAEADVEFLGRQRRQGLLVKGKQRFGGRQDDDRAFVEPLPVGQERSQSPVEGEYLTVGIRALDDLDRGRRSVPRFGFQGPGPHLRIVQVQPGHRRGDPLPRHEQKLEFLPRQHRPDQAGLGLRQGEEPGENDPLDVGEQIRPDFLGHQAQAR